MLPSLEGKLVNERKFSGHVSCLPRVLAVVGVRCAADDWFATGVVNSIYFDTPDLSAYREKANGDNIKTKIRMRWYGRAEELAGEVPVFLEVKYRLGSARRKLRHDVTIPRSLLLDAPLDGFELADFFTRHAPGLDAPVSRSWRPVCCISYNRRRYFDTPTMSRVAVDWGIRADRFSRAFFPWGRPVALASMVCEFKNQGGDPPAWARAMRDAGLRFGRFSKYGECVQRLLSGEP